VPLVALVEDVLGDYEGQADHVIDVHGHRRWHRAGRLPPAPPRRRSGPAPLRSSRPGSFSTSGPCSGPVSATRSATSRHQPQRCPQALPEPGEPRNSGLQHPGAARPLRAAGALRWRLPGSAGPGRPG
jgi:hypothetical protein